MKYKTEFLQNAHKQSVCRSKELSNSSNCGCFYCKKVYEAKKIVEWTDLGDRKGKTAICPKCGIDAVLSDKFPIDDANFLSAMNKLYF